VNNMRQLSFFWLAAGLICASLIVTPNAYGSESGATSLPFLSSYNTKLYSAIQDKSGGICYGFNVRYGSHAANARSFRTRSATVAILGSIIRYENYYYDIDINGRIAPATRMIWTQGLPEGEVRCFDVLNKTLIITTDSSRDGLKHRVPGMGFDPLFLPYIGSHRDFLGENGFDQPFYLPGNEEVPYNSATWRTLPPNDDGNTFLHPSGTASAVVALYGDDRLKSIDYKVFDKEKSPLFEISVSDIEYADSHIGELPISFARSFKVEQRLLPDYAKALSGKDAFEISFLRKCDPNTDLSELDVAMANVVIVNGKRAGN